MGYFILLLLVVLVVSYAIISGTLRKNKREQIERDTGEKQPVPEFVNKMNDKMDAKIEKMNVKLVEAEERQALRREFFAKQKEFKQEQKERHN